MVQLPDTDIRNRDVLALKGLHVFHAQGSSCSQKLRIYLNYKGLDWKSHTIDVLNKENLSPYYMGIDPRGLVPALIHDGTVHIESNDIILYLEKTFPLPRMVPSVHVNAMPELLRHEDDLHLDLRTASFRFMMPPATPPKSEQDLAGLCDEWIRHCAGAGRSE